MPEFIKCSNCDHYHAPNANCYPVLKVCHEKHLGSKCRKVIATTAEEAAKAYAYYYYNSNGNDGLFEGSQQIEVEEMSGERANFTISVEVEVSYYAKRAPSPTDQQP